MRRAVIATVAAGLLAGCHSPVGVPIGAGADPDAIPRSVTVTTGADAARDRAHGVLAELGFSRREGAGTDRWTRRFPDDERWAFCPPLRVERHDDGEAGVGADGGVVEVVVATTPTSDGTRVTIDPRFVGLYRDPSLFTGARERVCNSFGIVETRFVEAMRRDG